MTGINRRTVLRGGAAVGAAGATFGVAVPKAMTGGDAQILALHEKWQSLRDRAHELDGAAVGTTPERYGAIHKELEALDYQTDRIADALVVVPANNAQELALKLRVIRARAGFVPDGALPTHCEPGEPIVCKGLHSAIQDAERLAGRA